jgi:two-component sensor histidine kinase
MRNTPGLDLAERCQKPYVTYGGYIGFMAFFVFAWFLPYKAGSYGEGLILFYLLVCTVGIYRTVKSHPMPPNPIVWQATNGVLSGVCFAVLCWAPVADVMHYPGPRAGFAFMVVCLAMHLTEAVWYEQQKLLAMRAERAEAERQLAEMRLSALKAQIEPHFIFNTIAHLRRLIGTDPKRAERMADELSDFLRASLKSLRDEFTTVAEDIKLVEAYLQIAAIRMGARLSIAIEVDPAVATRRIPPMMLLTLVENAIQHGIEPKPEGGRIAVNAGATTHDATQVLCLSVADSGAGFGQNASAGSGLGLANIRERLRSVYGNRAKLMLSNGAEGGVLAQLHIPLEDAK